MTKNAGEIGYCVLLDGEAVPTSSRLKGGGLCRLIYFNLCANWVLVHFDGVHWGMDAMNHVSKNESVSNKRGAM